MWCIFENISCALEKNVYYVVLWWIVLWMSNISSWLILLVKSLYPYLFSVCSINYKEGGIEIFYYKCGYVYFSLNKVLLKVLWSICIRCIHLSVTSSWGVHSFIIKKWAFLFIDIVFALKSTYSFQSSPEQCSFNFLVTLYFNCVSSIQHMV